LGKGQKEMLFIHCPGFPKFRENTHHVHLQVTLTSKSAPEKQHRFRTPSKTLYFLRVQKAKKLLVASMQYAGSLHISFIRLYFILYIIRPIDSSLPRVGAKYVSKLA